MAMLGFGGPATQEPQRAMRAFFVARRRDRGGDRAVRGVLKSMKVVPLAMLGTYVATFLVFWLHWPTHCRPGRASRHADADK